jgi:glucose/mannose-6-phosphate isomerase
MNLDDTSAFAQIDTQNMLAEIDALPEQLLNAWDLGSSLPLPHWEDVRRVLIAGMGGSAIGGDLLTAYAAPYCHLPVLVHRDYDLPAWAVGPKTLVIASSHSGNTEETLSAFEQAKANRCRILAVTTGGRLVQAAHEAEAALWQFQHDGQPRAAVGYSFGLLLAALTHLGLLPDPTEELSAAAAAMQAQRKELNADVPVHSNPAKRLAGQMMGRWVTVVGAGVLAPVARRLKSQINELAKTWGQFEHLPEADHNTLAGVINPEAVLPHTMVLFLRAPSYHPRNALRTQLTKTRFMLEGLNTDFINAKGESRLDHLWTSLHFGDYSAYYLAMAYGMDPTPVAAIESLKAEMQAAGGTTDSIAKS